MKQAVNILLLALSLSFVSTEVWAQAKALYSEGVSLMKQERWVEAINKFEASKVSDTSQANKSKCDKNIAICKRQISNPRSPKKTKPTTPRISLKTNMANFEAVPSADGIQIEVINGDIAVWNFNVPDNAKTWCSAEKTSDGGGLVVKCIPSTRTIMRNTKIEILSVTDNYVIHVQQQGIKASLAVSSKIVSAKKKGDQIVVPVVCTSDTVYADGNSWRVLSAPKWCHQVYKKKPNVKGLQKAFLVVSNGFADTGKEVKYQEDPAGKNELVLNIDKLDKAEGKERTGDIVLECQGQTERFSILQK